MTITIRDALKCRNDFSPFLVHLTAGSPDGLAARNVLIQILRQQTLKPGGFYCLGQTNLQKNLDAERAERIQTVCFSEAPLHALWTLVQVRRTKGMSPYGLVFEKRFIREGGGQPAAYLNLDHPSTASVAHRLGDAAYWLRRTEEWTESNPAQTSEESRLIHEFKDKLEAIVGLQPFLNVMERVKRQIDFHWEREWRITGPLIFGMGDLVLGLCPSEETPDFERITEEIGLRIKFVDPNWGWERIKLEIGDDIITRSVNSDWAF